MRVRVTGAVLGALLPLSLLAAQAPASAVSATGSAGSSLSAVAQVDAAPQVDSSTKGAAQKKASQRKAAKRKARKQAARKAARKATRKAARKAAAKTPVPTTVHRLPFVCSQQWAGSTRAHHSPSGHAIDFNATDDLGKPVLASAAGRVVTSNNSATTGYGRHVVVDHGNGESSVYAHLQHAHVVVGTWVDQGTLIGQLGSTGNSSGPHLHYEQKVGRTVVAPWMERAKYAYGTSASTNCSDVPLAGSFFEGEGAQVAVFRRGAAAEVHVRTAQGGTRVLGVGNPYDEPVVGDWTGEGLQSVGAFSPISRTFTLPGEAGFFTVAFGDRGDRPVAGDWDGDGRWEVGVHRPSTSTFRLRSATGAVTTVKLGKAGDVPVTGDWDGDGLTDVGVFDPATATFTLRTRAARPVTTTVRHGAAGDLPVVADWNGDGLTDVGTWTPSTATFAQRVVPAKGGAARTTLVRHGRAR